MSSAPVPTVARPRWTARLTREEWVRLAGMGAFVLALHVVGWFTLLAVIAPKHYAIGNQAFGAGLGLTAYTLGMRHAFDADHIAAIDNTTRKLMGQGKRPLSVGFWFSLGHSSIVFGLCALLAFGVRSLASSVETDGSQLHRTTNLIGTSVSGVFLLLIGLVNLGAFNGILKVFRKMRGGHFDEAELEQQLDKRGFLNRILGRVTRAVTKSWHMYPVGMLFGLGFDTATEVSLLVLAGGAAAFSLPWYALLVLPVLFAAGMSLLDTIDGSFMNFAYEWAFSKPVRKIYYNLTVTGLSVLVALVIGVIELVGLLADQYDITGGPVGWIASLDLNNVGFAIVGLFVVTWAGALAFWKFGRVEEKWSAPLAGRAVPEGE
ncbi:HoxN/HupN/NixA family nickel/cobalt transporter [Kitasatospora sp. GAS204B]|uniref:HoxN/HupN/NixA family nickel/cobalt transporter n=1 Tax=unclassified Kitasatospora TaxID=2633591 RepID=UPI002473DA77|nr:HoxN/HupN/NixA family nickel/cobalt transporter [Kitasatospora sp. GAS204B]MDH6116115.1 high-affinity nickel-transport protein [Kitasatospora sp. GAS204B]